ncbi:MAG: hypothetical protein ABEJ02_03630 [Candidatus Paceibacteria bacterium]
MKEQLYPLKLYLKDLPNKVMFSLGLVINILIWVWLAWHITPQEEPIFLHYNILFGVDLVGQWWKVYVLPFVGLLIFLVNGFIGWLSFHKDRYIAYFLNATAIICQIFIFVSAYLLVFLNI